MDKEEFKLNGFQLLDIHLMQDLIEEAHKGVFLKNAEALMTKIDTILSMRESLNYTDELTFLFKELRTVLDDFEKNKYPGIKY